MIRKFYEFGGFETGGKKVLEGEQPTPVSAEEILYKHWSKWVNLYFKDAEPSKENFSENFDHSFVIKAMEEYAAQSAPKQSAGVKEVLEWYVEKAESMQRYTESKNTTGQLAIVTELSLDGGNRAKQIQAAQSQQQEETREAFLSGQSVMYNAMSQQEDKISDAIEFVQWLDKYTYELEASEERHFTTEQFYEIFKKDKR